MDDADAIEPFGFFTFDALRAGWYLVWRQMLRVLPAAAAALLAAFLLTQVGLGAVAAVVLGLGMLAVTIWAAVLIPRLTIQWAEQWYGATLTGEIRIWWGVTWRVFVASLVAAVILTPLNFVALSLSTAFASSALGMLGGLLTVLLGVANFVVTILATGWAMSKVGAAQISTLTAAWPVATGTSAPASARDAEPMAAPVAVGPQAPVAASRVTAPASVARPAPAVAGSAGAASQRQCPKCSLYETERGSVIGWYCRVCGWRETPAGRRAAGVVSRSGGR
ncbi:MAG TPA: hypothetical protein VFV05_20830 [Methylomirabilota bacterium]|nr:hypothetical protein [Methylomirabilota bacterium]